MFKHAKCGGRHETVAEAKACEVFTLPNEHRLPEAEAEAFLSGATEKLRSAHATSPILASMAPRAGSIAEAAVPFGQIDRAAIRARRIDSLMDSGATREATPAQVSFLASLVAERDSAEASAQTLSTIERLREHAVIAFDRASEAISDLKLCPKKSARAPQKAQEWRKLAEATPVGRYALPTGPGQDKTHFYRLSERNGFYKLQEQASDALYDVELKNYAEILRAIAEFGIERSGRLYAEMIGSCRRCGRTLTDENNPYKEIGYGPDCGARA
jgi:hypothetical protein